MSLKIKGVIGNLIVGALLITVGILINNYSDYFLQIILVAVGLGTLVDGLSTLMNVKRFHFTNATRTLSLIKAVESVVTGAVAIVCVFAGASSGLLTVIVYIFAAGLVFSAIVAFQNAIVAGSFNASEMKGHFVIQGVITLLVAIILFAKPMETIGFVVKLFAIGAIVIGVLILLFAILRIVKGSKEKGNAVEGEAEIIDEK